VLGGAEDLAGGRGLVLGRRAKAEVVEDLPDRELIGEEGCHLHRPAAASADERIDLVDLGDEAGPGGRTTSAGWLGGALQHLGRVPPTCAPGSVGVLPIEDGAVLSGVGDVVAHAGQPLERVEGPEVAPQGRVHAGAVEDGLLAIEVDELAEREWVRGGRI